MFQVYWILKAVGKFKIIAKQARRKVALRTINRIAGVKLYTKYKSRLQRRKELLVDFLRYTAKHQDCPYRKMMKYYRLVIKIKRNFKLMVQHQRLKYSIMNYQWSEFEKIEIKLERNRIALKKNNHERLIPVLVIKYLILHYRLNSMYIRRKKSYLLTSGYFISDSIENINL